MDDGSPDGTGQIADRLAAADARVRVLHRAAKAGLGRAYLAGGALFLILADAVARVAAAPVEIPVGVITALFGAPFFIWLLRRTAGEQ